MDTEWDRRSRLTAVARRPPAEPRGVLRAGFRRRDSRTQRWREKWRGSGTVFQPGRARQWVNELFSWDWAGLKRIRRAGWRRTSAAASFKHYNLARLRARAYL